MSTSTTLKTTYKSKNILSTLLLFLLVNVVISLIFLFITKNFTYPFLNVPFALNPTTILWVTFGVLSALGITPYFLHNISNGKTDRQGLKLNYHLYYIMLLAFLSWSLFTYTLSLPIVGLIILAISIIIGMFTMYRFTTNTIVGGVCLLIWNLWNCYIFIIQLAYLVSN